MGGEHFEEITCGILVRVEPAFAESESDIEAGRYVWSYAIAVENHLEEPVQLLSRYWRITDAAGVTQEVRGQGVVGQQPVIAPGQSFSYSSAAPLNAPNGLMHGHYEMARLETGDRIKVNIPAFALDCPYVQPLAN